MEPFTITELSYAIIAISGAISGVLMVVWKSRCSNINCGYGCISCDRDPLPPPKNNDVSLEMESFNDATNI